ncbi:hypothetical protein ACS0TY_011461 [Phlomoides rotata]
MSYSQKSSSEKDESGISGGAEDVGGAGDDEEVEGGDKIIKGNVEEGRDDDDFVEPNWKRYFKKMGLLGIRNFSYKNTNKNLIAAFVERWHPEMNSLHLTFGEMAIILDDVFCITGLAVVGCPISSTRDERPLGRQQVMDLLGVFEYVIEDLVGVKQGSSVKLKLLRKVYLPLMESEDEDLQLCAARAYVLYTFGCTLFVDKSGTRISSS